MQELKLLICEPNPEDLSIYTGLNSTSLGMDVSITNCSGSQLLAQIKAELPDIVLTEIDLPQISALDLISQLIPMGIHCHFILMSHKKSFDYVYSALKLKVEDYLVKPFTVDYLKEALRHIRDELYKEKVLNTNLEGIITQRYKFISTVCANPSYTFKNAEEINNVYCTHFCEGLFCALFAKLDAPDNADLLRSSSQSICMRLETLISNYFQQICYDVVLEKRIDGILFLINFHPDSKEIVYENINALFTSARQVVSLYPGINVTLCVGQEFDNIICPYELKNSALDTRWLRMSAGIDRIVLQQSLTVNENDTRFSELCALILYSCSSLNTEAFTAYINEFFELPYSVLSTRKSRKFVRKIIDTLLQINDASGHFIQNSNSFRDNLDLLLNTSADFKQFKETFCSNIIQLMQEIARHSDQKHSPQIYQSITYIIRHYKEHITLNSISEMVHLSPSYFSMLFKKETGISFSLYLIHYRMERAKELLSHDGTGNISEISNSVGYSDVRYFGKLFKRYTGSTPTEYRKLFHHPDKHGEEGNLNL